MERKKLYLLLDSKSNLLARGYLENGLNELNLQVRVAENKVSAVLEHEDLQLVGAEEDTPDVLGRIIARRGDVIVLEKLKSLGAEIRQNLRMPIQFHSFIYPLDGTWRGRRSVESSDLSCGGIAFYCEETLEDLEQMEIVIPVTTQPLILRCEILRQRLSGRSTPLYAAKFVDMCDDEERMVREAVFNVQVRRHANAR